MAEGVDGIVTSADGALGAGLVDRLPASVRIIATFSVGYDHFDLEPAAGAGSSLTNTPDVLTEATADIAMLCLLGAARRAWEAQTLLREHRWDRPGTDRSSWAWGSTARCWASSAWDGSARPWRAARAASEWRSTTTTGPAAGGAGAGRHVPR